MHRKARLLLLLPLTTLSLSACNPAMRIEPTRPPHAAARPVQVVPVADLDAEAIAALKLAGSRVADAKREQPGFKGADSWLAQARAASAQGNSLDTIRYAKQALARADLALLGKYQGRAKALVSKLGNTTGLSDAQYARYQAAETALRFHHPREAYEISRRLSDELKHRTKRHKVGKGESLWTIAKRDDIYANPWLWPLIWEANRDSLKNPGSVRAGQILKIRANPTVDEVVKAVNYAHAHSGTRIRIGEVQEVSPAR